MNSATPMPIRMTPVRLAVLAAVIGVGVLVYLVDAGLGWRLQAAWSWVFVALVLVATAEGVSVWGRARARGGSWGPMEWAKLYRLFLLDRARPWFGIFGVPAPPELEDSPILEGLPGRGGTLREARALWMASAARGAVVFATAVIVGRELVGEDLVGRAPIRWFDPAFLGGLAVVAVPVCFCGLASILDLRRGPATLPDHRPGAAPRRRAPPSTPPTPRATPGARPARRPPPGRPGAAPRRVTGRDLMPPVRLGAYAPFLGFGVITEGLLLAETGVLVAAAGLGWPASLDAALELAAAVVVLQAADSVARALGDYAGTDLGIVEGMTVSTAALMGLPASLGLAVALGRRVPRALLTVGGATLWWREHRGLSETPAIVREAAPAEHARPAPPPGVAVLLVDALPSRSARPVGLDERVAGMSLLERSVRGLARCGIPRIVCWGRGRGEASLSDEQRARARSAAREEGAEIVFSPDPEGLDPESLVAARPARSGTGGAGSEGGAGFGRRTRFAPPRALVVSARTSWDWRSLRDGCRGAGERGTVLLEAASSGASSPPLDRGPWLVPIPREGDGAGSGGWDPVEAIEAADGVERHRLRRPCWTVVDSEERIGEAEERLFASVFKASDGVHARQNRRLSLRLTRWLLRTPITANQITFLTLVVSLLSGAVLALGGWIGRIGGWSLLYLGSCVLDGSDGEVARLRMQESKLGCWLDTLCDYAFYVAVFVGLGVAVWRGSGYDPRHGLLVLLTWTGMVLTLIVLTLQRGRIVDSPASFNSVMMETLEEREDDPIYFFGRHCHALAKRSTMPYYFGAFLLLGWEIPLLALSCFGSHVFWPIALVVGARAKGRAGGDAAAETSTQTVHPATAPASEAPGDGS